MDPSLERIIGIGILSVALAVIAFFHITIGLKNPQKGWYIGSGLRMTGTKREWILLLLAPVMIFGLMIAILFVLYGLGVQF